MPEAEGILETTAGSVITVQLPQDRKDLWDKFSPEHFPVWSYGLTGHNSPEYGGFYGFPRTKDGKVKIGCKSHALVIVYYLLLYRTADIKGTRIDRGRKWTNYQTNPQTGKRVSTPRTKFTEHKSVNLPKKAIDNLKKAVGGLLPELAVGHFHLLWHGSSERAPTNKTSSY